MKILHLTKYFPPTYGGIENQAKYICDYLHEKKIKTTVLAFGKKNSIKSTNYKIFEVKPFFTILSQPFSIKYFFLAKKIFNQNDIIHFHYPNIMGLLVCFFFLKKKKLIIHWHSDIINQKYINLLFYPIEKNLIKRASKIIFTSKIYSKRFKYYKQYKKKIKVINCGSHDLSKEFDRRKELKKKFLKIKKKYENFNIIYSIGRLVKYKGYKYLIKSSTHLDKNTKIIIAGDGKEYSDLQKLIKRQNLNNKVFLIKKISYTDHLIYLKLCKVFCLPSISKNEAFGVALIEAMSFSKPLVSTNIDGSGIKFVNLNNLTGYVVPVKNSTKLGKRLFELINSKFINKHFSKNSKIRFQKLFTSIMMVRKFYKMYEFVYEQSKK